MSQKVVVCVSGGQDSTYCLFWAKQMFDEVYAVTFDYGQTHSLEKEAVKKVTGMAGVPLATLHVPVLGQMKGGKLTNSEGEFCHSGDTHPMFPHLPVTFVPLRNLILFSIASAYAVSLSIYTLVVGVSQQDYSGYPDCREAFLKQLTETINTALDLPQDKFQILAPLLYKTKEEEVSSGLSIPGLLEAWAFTHTCYNNLYPPCGVCDACRLRAKGFEKARILDPLMVRACKEHNTRR